MLTPYSRTSTGLITGRCNARQIRLDSAGDALAVIKDGDGGTLVSNLRTGTSANLSDADDFGDRPYEFKTGPYVTLTGTATVIVLAE